MTEQAGDGFVDYLRSSADLPSPERLQDVAGWHLNTFTAPGYSRQVICCCADGHGPAYWVPLWKVLEVLHGRVQEGAGPEARVYVHGLRPPADEEEAAPEASTEAAEA